MEVEDLKMVGFEPVTKASKKAFTDKTDKAAENLIEGQRWDR